MTPLLLLAEPDPLGRTYLERQLACDGFEVVAAGDGEEALELAERTLPDIVVLAGDGALCGRVREVAAAVPLVVLGGPDADAVERVRAFAQGADDYLVKPFLYDELLARVRAVLRRAAPPGADVVEVGAVRIDRAARVVTVRGRRVALAGKEYELLVGLARDPARVFTKEQLLREVWGFRSLGRTRTLDTHASRLRRKLADAGAEGYVENEWGVGYRLLAPAEPARASPARPTLAAAS